jgi:hypothetical protein
MIRRTLPVMFSLLFSAPLLAGQQTLFNFVRPAAVVNVTTQDAAMPQYNAEQTAEGEVLRRVVFNRWRNRPCAWHRPAAPGTGRPGRP